MDFLTECSENETFKEICPISNTMKKRYENLELVIRFFAYLNRYEKFNHRVDQFLDDYVVETKDSFDRNEMNNEFVNMLNFVKKYFPNGFAKTKGAKSTPRVRFEAISVGVALALRENPKLVPQNMDWLDSEKFKEHTTTHASNSPSRVKGRILYVKNKLLEGVK